MIQVYFLFKSYLALFRKGIADVAGEAICYGGEGLQHHNYSKVF